MQQATCDALVYSYLLARDGGLLVARRFNVLANPSTIGEGSASLQDLVQHYQDSEDAERKPLSVSRKSASRKRDGDGGREESKRCRIMTKEPGTLNLIDSLDEVSADEECLDDSLMKEINKLNETGPDSSQVWTSRRTTRAGTDMDKSTNFEEPLNSADEISVSDASSDEGAL